MNRDTHRVTHGLYLGVYRFISLYIANTNSHWLKACNDIIRAAPTSLANKSIVIVFSVDYAILINKMRFHCLEIKSMDSTLSILDGNALHGAYKYYILWCNNSTNEIHFLKAITRFVAHTSIPPT